ncbi:MAG: non-canonical purine NTP pyrophosphatase [Treponema sp.]|jgi:XTP/dITP diphosphohydrolase|nr:non-canonical purine NTP pyrophosphatase [Treponema sp.]
MIIWLASGNEHKKRELAAIFPGHELRLPVEGGIGVFEPDENGTSFAENALIKARALWTLLAGAGIAGPVLADDSGLCVDALGGRPGIYSARYHGAATWTEPEADGAVARLSDGERNALLLDEVNAALAAQGDSARRSCRFVCAMVLLWETQRFFLAQETLEGRLAADMGAAAGSGGFGYDPVVFLPLRGCTAAELSADEKNALSHRGKAGKIIRRMLESP